MSIHNSHSFEDEWKNNEKIYPSLFNDAPHKPYLSESYQSAVLSTHPPATTQPNWHQRTIEWLNASEEELEKELPNHSLQQKIDAWVEEIKTHFKPLEKFNVWLDSNGEGDWVEKLAVSLAKSPLRAARNLIGLLYNLIASILYAGVHPLKALHHAAKHLVDLAYALTQPATWSKLGIGILGGLLGSSLMMGTAVSHVALIIGMALLFAGISVEALQAALHAERGERLRAIGHAVHSQMVQLPESLLTGFFMGLIMGGVQRAVQARTFQAVADKFIADNQLPSPDSMTLNPITGEISLKWQTLAHLQKLPWPWVYEHYLDPNWGWTNSVTVHLSSTGATYTTSIIDRALTDPRLWSDFSWEVTQPVNYAGHSTALSPATLQVQSLTPFTLLPPLLPNSTSNNTTPV